MWSGFLYTGTFGKLPELPYTVLYTGLVKEHYTLDVSILPLLNFFCFIQPGGNRFGFNWSKVEIKM